MRALLAKELREQWTLAALALGLMVVAVGIDRWHNRHQLADLGSSIGFCVTVSVVLALFVGASVFARESRRQQVFVASWPLSRAAVWAGKAAVSGGLVAVVVALGYLCWVVVIGAPARGMLSDLAGSYGEPLARYGLVAAVALAYAFGLLWSGLVGSPHAAAGLAALSAAVLGFAGEAIVSWVSPRVASSAGADLLLAAGLTVAALVAAWVSHVRLPLLEARKRLGVCLVVAPAVVVLAAVVVGVAGR